MGRRDKSRRSRKGNWYVDQDEGRPASSEWTIVRDWNETFLTNKIKEKKKRKEKWKDRKKDMCKILVCFRSCISVSLTDSSVMKLLKICMVFYVALTSVWKKKLNFGRFYCSNLVLAKLTFLSNCVVDAWYWKLQLFRWHNVSKFNVQYRTSNDRI